MKFERGQASVFIIVAVLLVGAIVVLSLIDKGDPNVNVHQCEVRSDCRPASCCEAETCVSIEEYPDCTGVNCSTGCFSETAEGYFLGCGLPVNRGECECVDKKCVAVWP